MATRSQEIEREIEETRRDMTRTVGAIERRLSPDGMMDGAMSWLKTSPKGRAIVDDVTEVVSRNPLPLVLIGIGVGWLAWEMTNGGKRTVSRYRPMRDRLGPNVPVERHHMHVEDEGHSAYGRSPDAEDIVGYRRGTESAAQAAEAFRDMDRGDGSRGTGGLDSYGRASGASRFAADPLAGDRYYGEETTGTGPYRSSGGSTGFPKAGQPGRAGYGPSVTPSPASTGKAATTASATGSSLAGGGTSGPVTTGISGSSGTSTPAAGAGGIGATSPSGGAGTLGSTGSTSSAFGTGSTSGTTSTGTTSSTGTTGASRTAATGTGGSPDPDKLTGYNRSGEKASDAAKAFDKDKTGPDRT